MVALYALATILVSRLPAPVTCARLTAQLSWYMFTVVDGAVGGRLSGQRVGRGVGAELAARAPREGRRRVRTQGGGGAVPGDGQREAEMGLRVGGVTDRRGAGGSGNLAVEQEKETNVSEARHTEGPWQVAPSKAFDGRVTNRRIVGPRGTLAMAESNGIDCETDEVEANAALIAAAPAYREAWGMVPEKYRKAALEVLPPWVREAVKATGGDPGDEDAEAVRVRVAAPEMLEALRTTRLNILSIREVHPSSVYDVWLRVVEDAIAKAEGRQP